MTEARKQVKIFRAQSSKQKHTQTHTLTQQMSINNDNVTATLFIHAFVFDLVIQYVVKMREYTDKSSLPPLH